MADNPSALVPIPPTGQSRIPRFVRHLNDYAVNRGLDVQMVVAPYENDPQIRLWANWKAPRGRFLELGLLSRWQHLPCSRGALSVPARERFPLLSGDVTVTAGFVLWEIDTGPADFEITERDGVEIVTYADETLYHGTAEALVNQGIERKRLPLNKRPSKSAAGFYAECLRWWSRRQLDDTIVYRIESQSAYLERQAELRRRDALMRGEAGIEPKLRPSYLRLVVNNDRTKEVIND